MTTHHEEPEWLNVVRALKFLGKWPTFTEEDRAAAIEEIRKFERDEDTPFGRSLRAPDRE